MNTPKLIVYVIPLMSALLLIALLPCFAADSHLGDQIKAYNQKDFQQALNTGSAVIAQDPENVTAHYYLANTYCALKDFDKVAQEYSTCIKLGKDSSIASYAKQALSFINDSANAQPNSDAVSISDDSRLSSEISKLKEQYVQEEQKELDRVQKEADRLVDQITQRQNEDVALVPTHLYNSTGYAAKNTDYDDIVNDIRDRAQNRIKDIYDDLPKKQDQIRDTYERKIFGLIHPAKDVEKKQSYELSSSGTDLYVRNYAQTPQPKTDVQAVKAAPEFITVPTM